MIITIRKKPALITLGVFLVLIIAGIAWLYHPSNDEYEDIGMRPGWNISDNILDSPLTLNFSDQLKRVSYDQMLAGKGPFTVFAPTEDGYNNLPNETLAALSDPKEQGTLRQVLLYHVVKGRYLLKDFKEGMKLTTIQGEELTLTKDDDYWVVDGYAYIDTADVVSTNGVIHLTTNYLIPKSLLQK